jgi:hypothetical protein
MIASEPANSRLCADMWADRVHLFLNTCNIRKRINKRLTDTYVEKIRKQNHAQLLIQTFNREKLHLYLDPSQNLEVAL